MILLEALLDRPGRLVSRERLRQRIWGDDIHVDFEDGLNAAAWRLRQTLGDSAEHPVYIETVPRKGYRFLGAVKESPTREVPPLKPAPGPEATPSPGRRKGDRWQVRPGVVTAGVLALSLVGAATLVSRRIVAPEARIHSLAVLPLHNLAGGDDQLHLAAGLTEELIRELGKAGNLRVVPTDLSRRYAGSSMPLAHIARDLEVDALVEGSVLQAGGRCRLSVMLVPAKDLRQWVGTYESDLPGIHDLVAHAASDLNAQLK